MNTTHATVRFLKAVNGVMFATTLWYQYMKQYIKFVGTQYWIQSDC